MNLIDKDAVVATIKKHVQEERHSYFCKCLLSEIDALEVKGQPSLPDNLEEAAEEYARLDDEGVWKDGGKYKGFKAGAEWMAEQRAIKYWMAKDKDGSLLISNYKPYKLHTGYLETDSFKWIDISPKLSRELFPDIKLEDSPVEVIVQIRKKEE